MVFLEPAVSHCGFVVRGDGWKRKRLDLHRAGRLLRLEYPAREMVLQAQSTAASRREKQENEAIQYCWLAGVEQGQEDRTHAARAP